MTFNKMVPSDSTHNVLNLGWESQKKWKQALNQCGKILLLFSNTWRLAGEATQNKHNNPPNTNTLSLSPPLTYDVVIMHGFELMSPEVGWVLLELDGEAHVTVGLVTGEQQVRRSRHLTSVRLLTGGHQVQFIVLVLGWSTGSWGVWCRTDEVQTVPYLRVQDITPIITKPRERERERLIIVHYPMRFTTALCSLRLSFISFTH